LCGKLVPEGIILNERGIRIHPADSVWTNGKIYTADEDFSVADSLAASDGKIIFVGDAERARPYIGDATAVMDLGGRTVLPGLDDSHLHFPSVGTRAMQIDAHLKPKGEILALVREAAQNAGPGEWVIGRGWNQDAWDPPLFPTRQELDAVSPDAPVVLTRACGHMIWTNSRALELAGVNRDTPDPVGGEYLRDENGDPTGVITDMATQAVDDIVPALTEPQSRRALILAQEELFSLGLTSATDAGSPAAAIELMEEMYREGALKIRLNVMFKAAANGHAAAMLEEARRFFRGGVRTGLYGDRLQVRCFKTLADGSLGARSAWMLEDYCDRPGHRGNGVYTDEELYSIASEAFKASFQVSIHAIGDAANRQALDALQRVIEGNPPRDHRCRIEHAQVLDPADVGRFAKLGVIPAMQSIHAASDALIAPGRLGPKRTEYAYAWRKLLDTGVTLPNGTDSPVELTNPWHCLHAAITRRGEGMTREEALRSYTNWPAFASFDEDKKGSLEPGKLADFTVIDRDYMTCPADGIRDVEVKMTVLGGEVVYRRE
jgi:predicted amidohydrolase YtcJ